jgi:hypothetical protein
LTTLRALLVVKRKQGERRTVKTRGENLMRWEIEKIIEIANCIERTGSSPASMGEAIAAAFVLNRQDCLPEAYSDMVEAWDRLGTEWQQYVRLIKREYMHLIYPEEEG